MSGLHLDIRLALPGFELRASQSFAPRGVSAIFGASGSGKSTLLRVIAGLERAEGRVVFGEEVWQGDGRFVPPEARGIGYVFQDARLFGHLSVLDNLRYAERRSRGFEGLDLADVVELLDLGGLLARDPSKLSGGERQRVAIGRALLSRPRLLLLDEPLAALDEARKAEILPHLERLCSALALPILYVSHALAEVTRLADAVVLLREGRIVGAGPLAQVLADSALASALGPRGAGAVLSARLIAHHDDGLSELSVSAGRLFLPRHTATIGSTLRVRIAAQDVIVARGVPSEISALNILPAEVVALADAGAGSVAVALRSGTDPLQAIITCRSAAALALKPGEEVFVILKSLAIARDEIMAREGLDRATAP